MQQKETKTQVPTTNPPQKPHHEREIREKKPRPERKNQYQYNADIINQTTVIPQPPKKNELIPKPDIKLFKEKQVRNNAKIEEIIEKKKTIRGQKFKFNRKNQGDPDNKYSAFQNEIAEVQQVRQKFNEVRNERKVLKDQLQKAIEEAKANNERIKQYRTSLKGSRENFVDRLQQLEHRLITATITKEEEKSLTNQIMLLKRKIREAESSGNIEFKLEECEQSKERLDQEIYQVKKKLQPLNIEFQTFKADLDKKNENITGLKGQLSAEKSQKTEEKERHDKEYENWKEQKGKRLQKLQVDIGKIKEDNKKIWQDYHDKQDKYWKQKQLIDFIEWQTKVKTRKANQKDKEARKAQYQKRDKDREKEDQLKQYLSEIELINFLIKHLNDLRGVSDNPHRFEEKKEVKINPADIKAQIATDSQWKKEKGVEIIVSKKSKVEQEPEKKHKKTKKKEEVKQEVEFTIHYNVQVMFESLKLLAPTKLQEIDEKIKELRERELLFERVSREESSEQQKKMAADIKQKKSKGSAKVSKKQEADQFPTI